MNDRNTQEIKLGDVVVKAFSGQWVNLDFDVVVDFSARQVILARSGASEPHTLLVVRQDIIEQVYARYSDKVVQPEDSKRVKTVKAALPKFYVFVNKEKTKMVAVKVAEHNRDTFIRAENKAGSLLYPDKKYTWGNVLSIDKLRYDSQSRQVVKGGFVNRGYYDTKNTLAVAYTKLPEVLRSEDVIEFSEDVEKQLLALI